MGTRGVFGFRKNNIDKVMYNHFDSYPNYLGYKVAGFCSSTSIEEMNDMFGKIEMIIEESKPTEEQIKFCVDNNLYNSIVSNRSTDDWYCLLREEQGDLELIRDIIRKNNKAYMIDSHDFIKDSLFCEFGYIINLDTNNLEFYVGFQKEAQENNRYGVEADEDGYYPCKLTLEIPINAIKDVYEAVDRMNEVA